MYRVFVVLTAAVLVGMIQIGGYSGNKPDPSITEAKQRALVWLKNQKVPNSTLPDPQPERRNLVMSYEIDPGEPVYKYIYGRSIIYDDALAVIAFTMNGDYRSASQILLALKRVQRKDGGMWFGYNLNNDWPSEKDYEGSVDRTGATAWVGYSAVYYLKQRTAADASYLKTGKEGKAILQMAESIGDYMLKLQIQKSGDLRDGLITGGKNSFTLEVKGKNVNEIFKESRIDWISSEHNIDAYFFLRDLGAITGRDKYTRAADAVKGAMMKVWSDRHKQYYRGIKPGYVDEALALDCATWGAVFSLSAGKDGYAQQSLSALEKLYSSSYTPVKGGETVRGYKPYSDKDIYEEVDSSVARFYFPDLKKPTWDSIDGVWVEGTMGAAFAYLKAGNRDRAAEILKNVLPLQGKNGGFIYFTREIPHEFSTFTSTASTAWFIMVAASLEDQSVADSFWGR